VAAVGVAVLAVIAVPVAINPAPAHATPTWTYRTVELGSLGGGQSEATAVNDRGQVVGYSQTAAGPFHPFLWQHGTMTDLGVLVPGPDEFGTATDINNNGQVVGYSVVDQTEDQAIVHAFLWRRGTLIDLGTLGGHSSQASAINDRGEVVGWSSTADGKIHGFLWRNGTMTNLGVHTAADVNDGGQVVGQVVGSDAGTPTASAFRWRRGTLTVLTAPALDASNAVAINNAGSVAVNGLAGLNFNAYLWRSGRLTELAPGQISEAVAINDRGTVLGVGDLGAFLWRNGDIIDLGTRGITLFAGVSHVSDLNNRGQIAASRFDEGELRAVLYVR
jgi:probable HAF family extracellular repeat protein